MISNHYLTPRNQQTLFWAPDFFFGHVFALDTISVYVYFDYNGVNL